ncbi:MAG: exonuclease domain-containing protein [Solirubrobacteraceae bacterium]|nr:exonuclease domain-containing protein [Solirubrobacteraceae bacterium]
MSPHLARPIEEAEFAVVDLETTDFQGEPVEIGVVVVGGDGETRDEWSTLVRPDGPIAPRACQVHGLRDDHLVGAPTFDELLGDLDVLFADRVLAGHEVDFDLRALRSAFALHGHERRWPAVCTRRMGFAGALQREAATLEYVPPEGAWHQALADARATAALLGIALDRARSAGIETLDQLAAHHPDLGDLLSPSPAPGSGLTPSGRTFTRLQRAGAVADGLELVARTIGTLPAPLVSGDGTAYAEEVWSALADRLVTGDEIRQLVAVAAGSDLSETAVRDVHRSCFRRAAEAAAADHIITRPEQRDLACVAALLRIAPDDADAIIREELARAIGHATSTPVGPAAALPEGTRVVITGEVPYTSGGRPLSRTDMAALMTSAGLVPKKAVSGLVDLVVVCDPRSGSRKAEEARTRGIRVMVIEEFLEALGVVTD